MIEDVIWESRSSIRSRKNYSYEMTRGVRRSEMIIRRVRNVLYPLRIEKHRECLKLMQFFLSVVPRCLITQRK